MTGESSADSWDFKIQVQLTYPFTDACIIHVMVDVSPTSVQLFSSILITHLEPEQALSYSNLSPVTEMRRRYHCAQLTK